MKHDRWGIGLNYGKRRDQLAELDRMLNLLDSKPVPEDNHVLSIRLSDHINAQHESTNYEDEYFSIRYFQKGSRHITFKRPDLVEKMNNMIAKHYPEMMAAQ